MITNDELRALRYKYGLTQAQFAKKAGISTVLVAMMETGQKSVTLKTLRKIANAFDEEFELLIK